MMRFSFARFMAMLVKEFVQMRRDRLTFAMMIGVPILQLTLFGFAINSDPKGLPTVLHVADESAFARGFVSALENSAYFRIVTTTPDPRVVDDLLERGKVQFAVTIPAGFGRDI
ncbi:MAG TPA: ABC transporter permease, partial [Alphaproteobacteria bacterium]|nr:ABC transporter permease [Alphaproteobacteria bacterium]